MNTEQFSETGQMIELCCIWLYVLIMSCTRFRVNPHSIFVWIWGIWPNDRAVLHLTACSYFVMYMFQSESALYLCLNVRELLARNRCKISSLSDCNQTRTHNHLVCNQTINHLAKLAKWLNCVVYTYLYGAFKCMVSWYIFESELSWKVFFCY